MNFLHLAGLWPVEFQRALQRIQGRPLVGLSGAKRGLRDRHAKLPRIERFLCYRSRGTFGAIRLSS